MQNCTEFITSVLISILSNESKGQRNLQINIKKFLIPSHSRKTQLYVGRKSEINFKLWDLILFKCTTRCAIYKNVTLLIQLAKFCKTCINFCISHLLGFYTMSTAIIHIILYNMVYIFPCIFAVRLLILGLLTEVLKLKNNLHNSVSSLLLRH